MKKNLIVLIASAFLLSSCATIFTGTKDTIHFNTTPQGATVYIDGVEVCKTPCEAHVKRSLSDKNVEIRLDGYRSRVITLDREFNVVSILNLGGMIGWVVDAATGAIMKYDRKMYDLTLEPKDKALLDVRPDMIDIDTKEKVVSLYVYTD